MKYTQLIRFLLPLVLTVIVFELSLQVLSGGMARVPRAAETLASFGLAWGLVTFMTSAVIQARQLGLVLVDNRGSYKRVRQFVWGFGLLLAALLAVGLAGLIPGCSGKPKTDKDKKSASKSPSTAG